MPEDPSNRPSAGNEAHKPAPGRSMADVLTLPDDSRKLVNWLVRQGEVSLADVATFTGQGEDVARVTLAALAGEGFVVEAETAGGPRFRALVGAKRGRGLPAKAWRALDDKPAD